MMQKLRLVLAAALAALLMTIAPEAARADDCGFPPRIEPIIPNGKTASRDEVNLATRAVQTYAAVINSYLDCLDGRRDTAFLNMTTEQQTRWTEDYNKLVERLGEIEKAVNEEVRTFNDRDKS